jgi:Tetracyclin repressor-like, C-terminal domain
LSRGSWFGVDAMRQRAGRVIAYDEVVAGGRRHFLRRATIDMDALAAELSVSRSTLYRVVDGRDRLLGDVLWSLGKPVLDEACRAVPDRDVEGILEISRRFYRGVIEAAAFHRFVAAEAQTAVRVLFTPAGGVHERYVGAQREILLDATGRGALSLTSDVDSLAYLYVRIYESMLYADVLIGRPPDVEPAERAARALLLAG